MTQFSNKFKKPCFWPISGAKKIFLENLALSHTTPYGFLASCQNLGRTDRPYFTGPFRLPPEVQKVLLNFNPLQPGCCLFIPPENFKPHVLRGYKWAVPSCKELKHLLNNISTRMNNIQMQTRLNIFLRWIFSPNLNLKPMVMAIIFTRLSKSPLLTHFKPMLLFYTPWSIRYKDSVFQLSQNLLELHLKCIRT